MSTNLNLFKHFLIYLCLLSNGWTFGQSTIVDSLERELLISDSLTQTTLYQAIAKTYFQSKNHEKAIQNAQQAVALATTQQDTLQLRDNYQLIASCYYAQKDTLQYQQYHQMQQTIAAAYGLHIGKEQKLVNNLTGDSLIMLYDQLKILEDSLGNYTIETITSPAFQEQFATNYSIPLGQDLEKFRKKKTAAAAKLKHPVLNTNSVYWASLKVTGSQYKEDNYLFEVGFLEQSWDKVSVYYQETDGQWIELKTGLTLSPKEKDYPSALNRFLIPIPKNASRQLYFRMEGFRMGEILALKPSYTNYIQIGLYDKDNSNVHQGYYKIRANFHHQEQSFFTFPIHNHIRFATEYIIDTTKQADFEFIRSHWNQLDRKYPFQLNGTEPAYWARLRLIGNSNNTGLQSFAISDSWKLADIYLPNKEGGYQKVLAGKTRAPNQKGVKSAHNLFRLQIPANDTLTVFMYLIPFPSATSKKVDQLGCWTYETLHIDETHFWSNLYEKSISPIVLTSIILIQFLYFLILYFVNREKTHFYLTFFFLSLLILNARFLTNTYFPTILLPIYWEEIMSAIFVISLIKYSEHYLNIRTFLPKWYTFLQLYLLVFIVVLAIDTFCHLYLVINNIPRFEYPLWRTFNLFRMAIAGLAILFPLLAGIFSYFKGVKQAKFLILVYCFLLIGISGAIPFIGEFYERFLENSGEILLSLGFVAAILSLSVGTAYRIKLLKADQAQKEQAEATARAKQRFLANMSHEIRTPMNAIKGLTDVVLRRDPKPEQIRHLQAIKESTASLLVILNDILDISKLEAEKIHLEKIPFSITEVLQNVQQIMQFKAEEKGLFLKLNVSQDLPQIVIGDPTRLKQVLLNLVGNAIKFTEKGIVTIKLGMHSKTANTHPVYQFTVIDTGIGIAKDQLDKIFSSFEQADTHTTRKYGGTGLGLSIAKQLVELQGGQIWVASQANKGSQFQFTIPYLIADNQQIPKPTTPNISLEKIARLKGLRILLVEDNPFNVMVAKEELQDAIEAVKITVAENGEVAIEQLLHHDFDVVLMDVHMPVFNGYETTTAIRALKNDKANIPIIAMSASLLKQEIAKCYEAGMDGFIGKPFEVADLMEMIQRLMDK